MKQISESLSVRDSRLFIEECDVASLAEQFGTPLFVISESHLRSNLRRYKTAFKQHWPEGQVRIMPAIKASPILAVRRVLSDEGCGCDVFGPGELECALRGGVDPSVISVNGSIKDRSIIRRAIEVGARVVLDSPKELELCEEEAARLNKVARVMFRIKPFMSELETKSDFMPDAEIREMTQMIKYGIPTSEVLPMGPRAVELAHVEPIGIHVHMGRHSKKMEVWQSWVHHCVLLTKRLSDSMGGWVPREVDFGGGFPSFPDKDTDVYVQGYEGPSVEEYAKGITESFRNAMREVDMDPTGITLEIEPGRGLHCDTGIHLTTVHNVKEETENRPRKWVELDTSEVFLAVPGFNEEPPFDFIFANKADRATEVVADMVGQTCNAELLFNQVKTPQLEEGDVVALLNTGSYIEPMAANFNALPRPGTVLVCGDQAELVKRHETVDEVFSRDIIPDRLATLEALEA
jgi:diaminopimelate decarboxylase